MTLRDPRVMPLNDDLPRDAVKWLAETLGHDPDRISQITVYPSEVEVIYRHRVSDHDAHD